MQSVNIEAKIFQCLTPIECCACVMKIKPSQRRKRNENRLVSPMPMAFVSNITDRQRYGYVQMLPLFYGMGNQTSSIER